MMCPSTRRVRIHWREPDVDWLSSPAIGRCSIWNSNKYERKRVIWDFPKTDSFFLESADKLIFAPPFTEGGGRNQIATPNRRIKNRLLNKTLFLFCGWTRLTTIIINLRLSVARLWKWLKNKTCFSNYRGIRLWALVFISNSTANQYLNN